MSAGDVVGDHPFVRGERVEIQGNRLTITELDLVVLPKVRTGSSALARRSSLRRTRHWDRPPVCRTPSTVWADSSTWSARTARVEENRRSALVINRSTGEVGDDYLGDAASERDADFAHWREG